MAVLVSRFWLMGEGPAVFGWRLRGVSTYLLDDCITARSTTGSEAALCYILKSSQQRKLDFVLKATGTNADFLLLSMGREQKRTFSERQTFFADKGSFYQLGRKCLGNLNERSHFRSDSSHPLLPILYHRSERQALWEFCKGPMDPFSHLKTKPKQVVSKLLLRNVST